MIPSMGCLYEILGLSFRPKSILPHNLAFNFDGNVYLDGSKVLKYYLIRLWARLLRFFGCLRTHCAGFKISLDMLSEIPFTFLKKFCKIENN